MLLPFAAACCLQVGPGPAARLISPTPTLLPYHAPAADAEVDGEVEDEAKEKLRTRGRKDDAEVRRR